MRKLTIILFTFILAASLGASFLVMKLHQTATDITYTEETLYGDPAYAQGLELTKYVQFKNHLLWTSQITFDQGAYQSQTDLSYSKEYLTDRFYHSREERWNGISMNTYYDNMIINMDEVREDLEASCKPGQRATKDIRIADYFDYYPLDFEISIKDLNYGYNPDMELYDISPDGYEKSKGDYLKEYFRIPVLKDEYYTIAVEVGPDHEIYDSMGERSEKGDCFYLYTESAVSNEACYFWFDARTEKGNYVDTSLIQGGYGIYRLPYGKRKGQDDEQDKELYIDELSLFYPMNPKDHVNEIKISHDGQYLIVTTIEDGSCYLTILGLADGQEKYRYKLSDYDPDHDYCYLVSGDDYEILNISGRLYLFHETTDPATRQTSWTMEFKTQAKAIELDQNYLPFYDSRARVTDYDGEKLVICGNIYPQNVEPGIDRNGSGFYLAVYDKNGLHYYGKYHSSLDLANEKASQDSYDSNRYVMSPSWNANDIHWAHK